MIKPKLSGIHVQQHYPFTILFFPQTDPKGEGEPVYRIDVTGPGPVEYPFGIENEYGPVWSRLIWPSGNSQDLWP